MTMSISEIKSPKLATPLGIYSNGIKVTNPGSIIFLPGFTSRDSDGNVIGEGDIKAQTRRVLENMQVALEEAGATLSDVVRMTIYIRDMDQFNDIHDVRAEFFTKPYPACAMLEVSRMVSPETLIEIESIAVLPEKGEASSELERSQ